MNLTQLRRHIETAWSGSILERLQAYIRIPNKSPAFDADWERHGYMEQATELMAESARVPTRTGRMNSCT